MRSIPDLSLLMILVCVPLESVIFGPAIGAQIFTEEHVGNKVQQWVNEIIALADIAVTQPHAAYSAFCHGLASHWSYVCKTIPDINDLLSPLKRAIYQHFLPLLTGLPPCFSLLHSLSALPARLGGLELVNPLNLHLHLSHPFV